MNVLGLFDGMSCGQLALRKIGLDYDNYFASEIEKAPIKVTQHHFPDTVQLGDINNYKAWNLPGIDLLIGGSPCQDLSKIKGNKGEGLHGEKSKLFFKFVECLHKFKPKYFLLENVEMNQESEDIITSILGVDPVLINSNLFSAQDRPRLYWTNIPIAELPKFNSIVFEDIAERNVDESYFIKDEFAKWNGPNVRMAGSLYRYYPNGKVKYTETTSRVYNSDYKMACLTAVSGGHQEKKVMDNGRPRKLTPLEYERLQTVPDNYTAMVAKSQRYKMLGNGWTVDVIAHILKGLL